MKKKSKSNKSLRDLNAEKLQTKQLLTIKGGNTDNTDNIGTQDVVDI